MASRAAKQAIRKAMKAKLKELKPEEVAAQSKIVCEKVLSLPAYKAAERLSMYMTMPGEIQTYDIMVDAFKSGKSVFIPHYTADDMKMVKLQDLEDYESLPLTKWNIKQPRDDDVRQDAVDAGGLDVMLVPGVAFNRQGARLGHGRGYYDTYLSKYLSARGSLPLSVALAFSQQLLDDVPTDDHDRLIDVVMYPGAS